MPPPASNDNQGLKIAVACLAMLSVILAVTTYFGFKSYGEAEKRFTEKNTEATAEKKAHDDIQRILIDVKDVVGLPKASDDVLAAKVKGEREELLKKGAASAEEGRKAIAAYVAAGGGGAKLPELGQSLDTIVSGLADPAQSLIGLANRQQELLHNQTMIALHMAFEFKSTREILEAMNGVNATKLDVETQAVQATKKDLEDQIGKHEQDRNTLIAKVDALQTDLNRTASENATLKNQLTQKEDEYKKQAELLRANLRELKEQVSKTAVILDKKDGTVTFVDYERGEVHVDLTRGTGAKEQMVLTIFDKKAPGLPTDKPKGTIELIKVGNTGSIARIVETKDSVNPFRVGDQVYSSVWDPNRPIQYALIGKIDVNRDGRDDREDLKRMIKAAGGLVTYDLPPSNVGSESGKLSPLISFYVIDERIPIFPTGGREGKAAASDEDVFLKKRTAAIAQARMDGITPKPIERLLSELGYSFTSKPNGVVEAADRAAIDAILHPKGRVGVIPTPGDTEKKEGDDAPKPDAEKPEGEKP